jgi:hypothetical protein
MNKWTVLLLLFCTYAVQAEEVYLEGISFLGNIKKAYVVVDGVQMPVEQGDELGQSVIKEIQQRALILIDESGEEQILELYSKVDVTPLFEQEITEQEMVTNPFAQEAIEGEDRTSEILQKMPDGNPFAARPQITDDEIPQGKRRISTPFGDFLVDDVEQTQLSQQTDEKVEVEQAVNASQQATESDEMIDESTAEIEEDSLDHSDNPVIYTPFGNLPVNVEE